MQRRVPGVLVNDVAGNPFQPDIQYRGFVASPVTRICSFTGPAKLVTTTVTTGSRMYLVSAFSMSRSSSVGVLPIATMSSTSGVVIFPSGRTGTMIDRSALRQTITLIVSSGPMR